MEKIDEYLARHPQLAEVYGRVLGFLPALSSKRISVVAPAPLDENTLSTTVAAEGGECTVYFKHDPPAVDVFIHELIHCALPLQGVEGEEVADGLADLVAVFPHPFNLEKFFAFMKTKRALHLLEQIVLKEYHLTLGEFFRIQGLVIPCFESETSPFIEASPRSTCSDEQKAMVAVAEILARYGVFPQYREIINEFIDQAVREQAPETP